MCIFASPVEEVSNTRLFIAAAGDRQLTLYQMAVDFPRGKGNAMILPVPNPTGLPEMIHLLDLSKVPDLFDRLAKQFEPPQTRSRSATKGFRADASYEAPLKVHQVGSFEVSIVPRVDDIRRIDTTVFALSPATEATLGTHYARGFSFLVCQLKTAGAIHPLGYVSPRGPYPLFVPTRHEHGENRSDLADWDHQIYAQIDLGLDVTPRMAEVDIETSQQVTAVGGRMQRIQADSPFNPWFPILLGAPELLPFIRTGDVLYRMRLSGRLPNTDLRIAA